MDKSWIAKPRNQIEYSIGLSNFLNFAFENGTVGDTIRCLCPKCGFGKWQTRDVVQDHLLWKPFPENYVIWNLHGEKQVLESSRNVDVMQETLHSENLIDSEGAIKRIKLKVKEVNNLCSGERIIVNFDEYNAAYGEAQGLLVGYCETLATDCKLFPIHFERWLATFPKPTPKDYFNDCFETIIKRRFFFRTTKGIAKRYCNASIKDKWAAHRQKLWNDFYDTSMTRDEIISNVPIGIERDQWVAFVRYRLKPSTQELCRRNKEIRSKQIIPHTSGSKPNSRRRNELLENGQKVGRRKMYKITCTKKDGSFVNTEAMDKVEAIDRIMTQNTNDESKISPNDVVGKVFGEEHSGRVRTMDMGAAPTNTFRNTKLRLSNVSHSSAKTATSSSSTQWQERCLRLENALKAYMIMKEGSIPEELVGFFAPQPEQANVSSEPTTSLDARSSSGSNTNHQQHI